MDDMQENPVIDSPVSDPKSDVQEKPVIGFFANRIAGVLEARGIAQKKAHQEIKKEKRERLVKEIPANKSKLPATLRVALSQYESEESRDFLRHYFDLAFKDSGIAKDLASRLYPSLKAIEADMQVKQKILQVSGMMPISVEDTAAKVVESEIIDDAESEENTE